MAICVNVGFWILNVLNSAGLRPPDLPLKSEIQPPCGGWMKSFCNQPSLLRSFGLASEILADARALERDVVVLFGGHGGRRRLLLGALLLVAAVVVTAAIGVAALATAVVVAATIVTAVGVAALTAAIAVVVGALLVATALGLTAAIAAAEQLHILCHDADLAALLAGLLVLPGILLQAALDEYGAALGQVLAGNLSGAAPAGHIQECGFLAAFALVGAAAHAVHGEAQLSYGVAARGGAYIRISGQVADNHYFVQISHTYLSGDYD